MIDQVELLKFLNSDYYFSVNPHEIMNDKLFDQDAFFNHTDNSYITRNDVIPFDLNCPNIIKKLEIKMMKISIRMIPYKISLPLNKSLSVFDVSPKINKKYSACFGDEEEYLRMGYLDDGKAISKIKLKNRKYYRFVGMNVKINTIFPNGVSDTHVNMDELINNGIGEFDIKRIFE